MVAVNLLSPGKKDIRRRNPYFKSQTALERVKKFRQLCQNIAVRPSIMTLLWILRQPFADVVIPGPRTLLQLDSILALTKELNLDHNDKIKAVASIFGLE